MDNTVGQEDSRDNVTEEEEEVDASKKIEGENVEEKKVVEGEGKKDLKADRTDVLIAETASTQNSAVEGDTNQFSAEVSEKANNPPGPLKPQRSDNIPVSPESEVDIDLTQNIPASTSNSYKPNTMFFKPENHIASEPHSHTFSSDTNLDPEHSTEISEDGMIALRLTGTERTSPLMSPSPAEPLSPSTNTSNVIAPKQIVRIERDYSRGELCQFQTAFPMEIDGRINPRRFQQTINTLNEMLVKAFNPKYNWLDNCLACVTLYTSMWCIQSHYEKMIEEICIFLDSENQTMYNQNGLNFRNPQKTAFSFLEIELY